MTMKFSDYLNEQMKNDEIRREYEIAKFEYSLSQAVIHARQSEGLTQKQLAKKAGIKPSDLKKIECCQVSPSLDILQKIANAMGKKLDFVPASGGD